VQRDARSSPAAIAGSGPRGRAGRRHRAPIRRSGAGSGRTGGPGRQRRHRRRRNRLPARDLRARDPGRVLRGLVRDAGAAHAVDVRDQRHLFGDRGRCAARGRRAAGRAGDGLCALRRFRRACPRLDQHLWRLPGDAAHARHVPEEGL
ncbi:MAG: NAD(P) transhydrogenase alpha subunit, partial [uncultured Microvirga sp.]